ncbi:ATP synthase complex subunit H-domain-containing protein [Lanmaoa asiatica]|nr:ATP synthase complex subunit H-domain-containing protein [Lanmaoa asiatica]
MSSVRLLTQVVSLVFPVVVVTVLIVVLVDSLEVHAGARAFSSSASRRDLIQDFYIRELKSYKPPVAAKDAHVGSVKIFTSPAVPKPPVLPADLAADLAAYDAAEPTKVEDEVVKPTGLSGEQVGGGAEAFLTFLEADVKPAEAHH